MRNAAMDLAIVPTASATAKDDKCSKAPTQSHKNR